MSTNTDIQSMIETATNIFEAANSVVDKMADGERKQIKDLAVEVGLAVSLEPKHVLGFVNHFVHNTTVAYVTRGKNGGLIKGVRPVKVVKVKKDDTTDSTV